MIRAAALLLALTVPAAANPLQQATDWAHCLLYPSHARCHPPAPPAAPVQPPPAAPVYVPAPPPVVAPVPAVAPPRAAPPARAKKRVKTKAVPQKPKRKGIPTAGPDLQWPCWMVRLNAGTKSCADLAAEGRRRNITLTPKQHYQAAVCIGRCFP
jgi:outer membrane biosynthesis protein TonB